MPRGPHDSHGLSTTRSPVSARRPTTSWPSTCGNDTSAVSGLSRAPFSNICFTSEPHNPENVVSTRIQSCAGSGSSSMSSSRTGAKRETKARRSTRPPIADAASLARLCWKTSAFTPTSFGAASPPSLRASAGEPDHCARLPCHLYRGGMENESTALAARLREDMIGALELFTVYLGERLGLYRALADGGPVTSTELAARTGTAERYIREWLEHHAVSGLLDVDDPSAEP